MHVIEIKTVFINLRVKIMSTSVCTIIRHYAMFSLKSACLHPIFAATSLLLSGVMGTRFMRTGKFMPAGLVAGLRSDCEEIEISQLIFDNDLLSLCCMNLITYFSFLSVLHKLFACLTS